MIKKNSSRILHVLMVICLVALSGCENGNLFGKLHDSGDSSDPEALLSDADIALRNQDYSRALSLYERVLAQDADNSEALFGASISAVGSSGINFGQLIANITAQTSVASSYELDTWLAASRESISANEATATSILAGIDLATLDTIINTAICRLQKIVAGAADGSINKNDISILMNLASLCVIRAVLRPVRANVLDITNTNGTYTVTKLDTTTFDNICSSNPDLVRTLAADVAGAYALFNRAVNLLNLGNDQLITKIRDDVGTAINMLLNTDAAYNATRLPSACLTIISDDLGITHTNYQNYQGPFNPPSGC